MKNYGWFGKSIWKNGKNHFEYLGVYLSGRDGRSVFCYRCIVFIVGQSVPTGLERNPRIVRVYWRSKCKMRTIAEMFGIMEKRSRECMEIRVRAIIIFSSGHFFIRQILSSCRFCPRLFSNWSESLPTRPGSPPAYGIKRYEITTIEKPYSLTTLRGVIKNHREYLNFSG